MSEDLLTIGGTPYAESFGENQVASLSRWELINFFSCNVHGIRDLLLQVASRIYCSGFGDFSEYFHHFLDEENKHMWFFAEFCKRYGQKIYATKAIPYSPFPEEDIQAFVAFSRILISEEIGDFYNVRMMKDERLPSIVREVNRIHHMDESRHITMGRIVVQRLCRALQASHSDEVLKAIVTSLSRFMLYYLQSFYNPSAYGDAGLDEPYALRTRLVESEARRTFHRRVLNRSFRFFRNLGLNVEAEFLRISPTGCME
jgi:hypothetical protein